VEKPLQPIAQPEPKFPVDVVAELGKGSVTLRFMVQADGTVSEPEVLSSSHRRLNRPALEAVALWRFEPIPEPRKTQVELVFNQDD
jgi:TonB family protein